MPNINLSFEGTIATLTFDRIGSTANLLDTATIDELATRIDEIQGATGLIICSAKPAIFIAGADFKELASANEEQLSGLIKSGQQVFNRIADLPFTTIAAINGACVGGGFELALACDWRIASDSPHTRIGLPETRFGILPALGGSTRLPDLIGLQGALNLIIDGKILKADSACKTGLVDALVPVEYLIRTARDYIGKGKRHLTHNPLIHNHGIAAITRRLAHNDLLEKSKRHHLGQEAALEVLANSIGESRENSQKAEHDAILGLWEIPETKRLMRLFFLNERARNHRHTNAKARPIHRAAVMGAGAMGSAMAYWMSARKMELTLQDLNDEALALGMHSIDQLYQEAIERDILTPLESARGRDRIHVSSTSTPLTNCDLIIEAATEDLATKQKIFADLSARSRPDTLLATNTSALPVRDLIPHVSHPERLLGLHFFNPIDQKKLVEVIHTDSTSDESVATAVSFVRKIGKLPIVVRDSPGFLVNRILMPYLLEAVALFENGGDPADIDDAMLDFGMSMGPLRLLDEIGFIVVQHVAETLAAAFPERMRVPGIIGKLIHAGHAGRTSGSGFYNYDDDDDTTNAAALDLCEDASALPNDLQQRLADLMTGEARRCLDEGIAARQDIELAMILGVGYPPFRDSSLTGSGTRIP